MTTTLMMHSEGYAIRKVEGKIKREHRLIAERAIGRALDPKHPVHHVDIEPGNNANSNLVICEDQAYHFLLHLRQRALLGCGNPDYRKCIKCGGWDDPNVMNSRVSRLKGTSYWHSKH